MIALAMVITFGCWGLHVLLFYPHEAKSGDIPSGVWSVVLAIPVVVCWTIVAMMFAAPYLAQ